jgi:hypothetical protein
VRWEDWARSVDSRSPTFPCPPTMTTWAILGRSKVAIFSKKEVVVMMVTWEGTNICFRLWLTYLLACGINIVYCKS